MAGNSRSAARPAATRRTRTTYTREYGFDGSAARQVVVVPKRERVEAPATTVRTRRNRAHALSVSRGYVVFLAMMTMMTVLMCVYYLQMRSTVTAQNEENARLESRLTRLQSENDALYENITNQIDWTHIRDVAVNELGMSYPTEEQVIWYNREAGSYVMQYQALPDGN